MLRRVESSCGKGDVGMRTRGPSRQLAVLVVSAAIVGLSAIAPVGAAPRSEPAPAWAKHVCQGTAAWTSAFDRAAATAQPGAASDAVSAKKSLLQVMRATEKATAKFAALLRRIGEPDVARGDEIADRLLDGIETIAASLREARRTLKQVPTTDSAAFALGAAPAAEALASATLGVQVSLEESEELHGAKLLRAFRSARACRSLTRLR